MLGGAAPQSPFSMNWTDDKGAPPVYRAAFQNYPNIALANTAPPDTTTKLRGAHLSKSFTRKTVLFDPIGVNIALTQVVAAGTPFVNYSFASPFVARQSAQDQTLLLFFPPAPFAPMDTTALRASRVRSSASDATDPSEMWLFGSGSIQAPFVNVNFARPVQPRQAAQDQTLVLYFPSSPFTPIDTTALLSARVKSAKPFDFPNIAIRTASTNTVALFGRAFVQTDMTITFKGSAPLSGQSDVVVKGQAAPTGATSLVGRASAMVSGVLSTSGPSAIALFGALAAKMKASAATVYPARLASTATSHVKAGATSSVKTALSGATKVAAFAKMVPPGAIALIGRMFAKVAASAAPKSTAALQGQTTTAAKATGTTSGKVAIAARAVVKAAAKATMTAATPLQALAGILSFRAFARGLLHAFKQSPRVAKSSNENRTASAPAKTRTAKAPPNT